MTAIRKDIPLTAARVRELLRYDPDTGELTWRVKGRGSGIGNRAGAVCGPYRQICVDGVHCREHRLIWFMETGEWPPEYIDHRNRIGTDNRWLNLRCATPCQNNMNRDAGKNSKTGIVGVCPDKASGKYEAHITVNGRLLHLGKYECVEAASAVRCEAARHYFGDFARQAEEYGYAAE